MYEYDWTFLIQIVVQQPDRKNCSEISMFLQNNR